MRVFRIYARFIFLFVVRMPAYGFLACPGVIHLVSGSLGTGWNPVTRGSTVDGCPKRSLTIGLGVAKDAAAFPEGGNVVDFQPRFVVVSVPTSTTSFNRFVDAGLGLEDLFHGQHEKSLRARPAGFDDWLECMFALCTHSFRKARNYYKKFCHTLKLDCPL